MVILNYFLFFLSGILLEMGLVHLFNFSETRHHSIIARAKRPHLATAIWGLGYLFFGLLILLLLHYQFTLQPTTLAIFLGFSSWAIFLAMVAERRKMNKD